MLVAEQSRNAFSIMTASQHSLSQSRFPDTIVEQNKKDGLYRTLYRASFLIEFWRSHNLSWASDDSSTVGARLMQIVCDALWHINGHHLAFAPKILLVFLIIHTSLFLILFNLFL